MSFFSSTTRNTSIKPLSVLFANAIILALWLWLFRPVYPYLGTIFTRQEFRTNQVVLLAILLLISLQVRRDGIKFPMLSLPQLHPVGLALALSGAAAFIAAERWLDINTLSASLFGLATYIMQHGRGLISLRRGQTDPLIRLDLISSALLLHHRT